MITQQRPIPVKATTIRLFFIFLFSVSITFAYGQQKKIEKVNIPNFEASLDGAVFGATQDHQGYIWFIVRNKGLYRYDGSQFVSYVHDAKDDASITDAPLEAMTVDSNDVLWMATFGGGVDKFDPVTNKFTHFKHQADDPGSLANDTTAAILVDHDNNVWVGTYGGLDRFDRKTEKFIHHANKINDPSSLSSNEVRSIYEDKSSVLWVGCGDPLSPKSHPNAGGLNRLDKVTGKFIRYLHDPANPNSIANNKVRAILEDSKGNFWVGTAGDGLQTLDRGTGIFTHYYYDSKHPENLSRGPLAKDSRDYITFINEDGNGRIWIGTLFEGINEYDPQTKKIKHHGFYFESWNPRKVASADTATGFKGAVPWTSFSAKDGTLWITAVFNGGGLYKINPSEKVILPFSRIPVYQQIQGYNTFYKDNSGTLWIGVDGGLVRKNEKTGVQKIYLHDDRNSNSLIHNNVYAITMDDQGMFWLGTLEGLDRFDPVKETFTHYVHDTTKASSLIDNNIVYVLMDRNKQLWIGTNAGGLDKMNTATGQFSHFQHNDKDSSSLSNNQVYVMAEDNISIWVATAKGLNRVNKTSGAISHYLMNENVKCVTVDSAGMVWAGTTEGLYYLNLKTNTFSSFDNIHIKMDRILYILEDDQQNLWISAGRAIYKIDKDRKEVRIYGSFNGVRENTFVSSNDYKTTDGELFIGHQSGYYHFSPGDLEQAGFPPIVNITGFQIGLTDIVPGTGILSDRIEKTDKITLAYNQNSFALSFSSIHFQTPGDERYLYMLENYDSSWHDASATKKVYFFSVPVGHYVFRVRAVNIDGTWAEKDLSIFIAPPWWATWWAIVLFVLLLIAFTWSFIHYRSRILIRQNKALEEKVKNRTQLLQTSIEELKSTQSQLIQSEKMASLGELTAGIAHEIQNPLNFINNFSEVNSELLSEMKEELANGNVSEAKSIADNINENEKKIIFHGKRADGIVKGMLQHSRSSSGQKEPTDINALADEYLRLAYHGLRAKDKTFNASMKTDFDQSLGNIQVVPQDMGRVILNLITNAFYAVTEKKNASSSLPTGAVGYEPTVSVSTKKVGDKVLISVKDNGNGIPQKVLDKILQPFFTTKPPGHGTGLGLSISYDIVKAHGGELRVETKEGEGSEFSIQLPV